MTVLTDLQTLIDHANDDATLLDSIISTLQQEASVAFASSSSSVLENAGTHTINVVLTLPPSLDQLYQQVDVAISVTGGTASGNGVDYTLSTTQVSFLPGSINGATQPVNLTIMSDTANDNAETVILQLGTPSGPADLGTINTHTITITNIWCYEYDFTQGELGWEAQWPARLDYGYHSNGDGWVSVIQTNSQRVYIIRKNTGPFTITGFKMEWTKTNNLGNVSDGALVCRDINTSGTPGEEFKRTASVNVLVNEWTGQKEVTNMLGAHIISTNTTNILTIKKITIQGRGNNPFSTSNCS